MWFKKNKNNLNLKFKPYNIPCMVQTRRDFIQASEIHSELLFRYCICYSDTRGVTAGPAAEKTAHDDFSILNSFSN
jgi:hypothetical protein